MASEEDSRLKLFLAIGLNPKEAESCAKSAKVGPALQEIIQEAKLTGGCPPEQGLLLYTLATKLPKNRSENRAVVSELIGKKQLTLSSQVEAAVKFLMNLPAQAALNDKELHESCGAGVVVTPKQIKDAVAAYLKENKATVTEERYRGLGKVLADINERLKWADRALVKKEVDEQLLKLLGPKTDADNKPQPKKKEEEKVKAASAEEKEEEKADLQEGRFINWAVNSAEALRKHEKETGGMIITRFPPEPNGHLHLGHAKAINFDFGHAIRNKGQCILRFDDTNPEAEKQEYFDSIVNTVNWLGFKPWKITYSSDYFPELYELAVQLIKRGDAYVCFQKPDEMEASREKREPSPHRDRSIEENLRLFEDMKKGKFAEGECTLRMKGDYKHVMPCMWDLVAYRIKYTAHPHAGSGWCIYPSYDFTHCIIDSLENVTHSLCTLEFETRRESYFWLLDRLDLYKPRVWEYSRLNLEYAVMSKRKLKQLVDEHYVNGWDDPRMITLNGLKRRGFTSEGINAFCHTIGVSRNNNTIPLHMFYHSIRGHLDEVALRRFAVIDPVKVTLTNYPEDKVEFVDAPDFPKDLSKGVRKIPFSRTIFIDRDDFRAKDEENYIRLAPGKEVRLKYAYTIVCTGFKADSSGKVTEVLATVDLSSKPVLGEKDQKKVKGNIHWVAAPPKGKGPQPVSFELRVYNELFTDPNPGDKDDWLSYLNPKSLEVVKNALGEPSLADCKPSDKFQFERLGYFCVDTDSSAGQVVINRTIPLKESKDKE